MATGGVVKVDFAEAVAILGPEIESGRLRIVLEEAWWLQGGKTIAEGGKPVSIAELTEAVNARIERERQ